MSGIEINLIADEMQRYVVQNRNLMKADFARATKVGIDDYCTKVTKIKGVYQTLSSVMTHIIQGFRPQWDDLGKLVVADKEHKSYRQKINFSFVPAEVLSTFIADLYNEKAKPTNKDIAKKIFEWIMIQATDDLANLSMVGERNNALAYGQFGYSLDGWNKIVKDALEDAVNPVYKIPIDPITSNNVIVQIKTFERNLPKILKSKIKAIHCSTNVLETYEEAYFDAYGDYPRFKDSDLTKTPLKKRQLVGWDDMDDDVLFATIDGNMLNLVDEITNPGEITDIQTQDYTVKVFGEFEKGYSILFNQAFCVANFKDSEKGLGNTEQMKLYYPHEQKPELPAPPVEGVTVTPSTSSIVKGNTAQFLAEVDPDGADEDVIWSVQSSVEGLSIDSDGLVTTTGSTPAADYTITATSVENDQISGTATLTVTND